ncbi:MAG: hypothetical protein J6S69_08950 [Proteobacteria bacterium]|nr:hypothetical protein [Pseudomonadota bacterium]
MFHKQPKAIAADETVEGIVASYRLKQQTLADAESTESDLESDLSQSCTEE